MVKRGTIWLSKFKTGLEFGPPKFQTGIFFFKHLNRQEFGSPILFPNILPKPITFDLSLVNIVIGLGQCMIKNSVLIRTGVSLNIKLM